MKIKNDIILTGSVYAVCSVKEYIVSFNRFMPLHIKAKLGIHNFSQQILNFHQIILEFWQQFMILNDFKMSHFGRSGCIMHNYTIYCSNHMYHWLNVKALCLVRTESRM